MSKTRLGMKSHHLVALMLFICCGGAHKSSADTLMVTRAAQASTIAEIFIEADAIRIELEIGGTDLGRFQAFLPDDLRKQLEIDDENPQNSNQEQPILIRADGGEPLQCRAERVRARPRVIRDEITGEPLAEQPQDAELVVESRLLYGSDK